MILDKIKELIELNIGKPRRFVFHGARNQNEVFVGTIIKLYPAIFLIELESGQVKSYCYSDVLTSNLEIID